MDVGETDTDVPVPIEDPPQEPLYHSHVAAVPRLPPETDNVVELPEQIDVGEADADEGAVELVLTVTVTDWHVVVLHAPSALT